jgi:hypothetical protein
LNEVIARISFHPSARKIFRALKNPQYQRPEGASRNLGDELPDNDDRPQCAECRDAQIGGDEGDKR